MRIKLESLFAEIDAKIIDILQLMNENTLKTAFIVDSNKKLLGLVSDGDIRRALLKNIPLTASIEEIMNKNPLVAKIGIDEPDVLNILISKNILIIPVLDNERRIVDYYHITDFIKEKYLTKRIKISPSEDISKVILVTGGAGYIGSILVRILLDKGYAVRVLDSLNFGEESIKDLLSNPNFELIKGDYTKIENLIHCLNNVYAVVHLAAIVGDPAGKTDPELTEEVNYYGVKLLAQLCKHYKIERFIFISTCSVYGASKSETLTENSALNPVSLYAETKIKAEKALLSSKSKNFSPCILRLATVFGLSYRMRFDLVINLLTALSVINKEISIFSGKQWRPFVHVKDVAEAIINILNQPLGKISGEIFNIGKNNNNFQIEEIGKIMKDLFPDITVHQRENQEDDRSYRVNFDKATHILEFNAERDIQTGIKEITRFIKENQIDIKNPKYSNYKSSKFGIFNSIAFFE